MRISGKSPFEFYCHCFISFYKMNTVYHNQDELIITKSLKRLQIWKSLYRSGTGNRHTLERKKMNSDKPGCFGLVEVISRTVMILIAAIIIIQLVQSCLPTWGRKVLAAVRNRTARKKKADGKITAGEWKSLKERYNYNCLCCGRSEPEIILSLDHVIPLSKGGINTVDNAQPLCISCNSSKGNKTIDYRK